MSRSCDHASQSTNGSNQYQAMLRCKRCGKMLAQVYHDADPSLLKGFPAVQCAVGLEMAETRRQMRQLKAETERFERELRELQWTRVVTTAEASTQTDKVTATVTTTTKTTITIPTAGSPGTKTETQTASSSGVTLDPLPLQ